MKKKLFRFSRLAIKELVCFRPQSSWIANRTCDNGSTASPLSFARALGWMLLLCGDGRIAAGTFPRITHGVTIQKQSTNLLPECTKCGCRLSTFRRVWGNQPIQDHPACCQQCDPACASLKVVVRNWNSSPSCKLVLRNVVQRLLVKLYRPNVPNL